MTAAVFGLIGVVVGGVIGGAVQMLLARRAERRVARVSARIVISEMRERRDLLARWLDYGVWFTSEWKTPKAWQWEKRRPDLADALSAAEWELVEQAYIRIRRVDLSNAHVKDLETRPGYDATLSENEREVTGATIAEITRGIDALRAIADLRQVGERPLNPYEPVDAPG